MALTEVVGLCHLVAMLSLLIFCTQDMEWSTVTLETVAHSRVVGVSPLLLGLFRIGCGFVVWGTISFILLTGKPLFMMVLLRDGNKRMVSLIGPQRFAMFTVWCWTVQVRRVLQHATVIGSETGTNVGVLDCRDTSFHWPHIAVWRSTSQRSLRRWLLCSRCHHRHWCT